MHQWFGSRVVTFKRTYDHEHVPLYQSITPEFQRAAGRTFHEATRATRTAAPFDPTLRRHSRSRAVVEGRLRKDQIEKPLDLGLVARAQHAALWHVVSRQRIPVRVLEQYVEKDRDIVFPRRDGVLVEDTIPE